MGMESEANAVAAKWACTCCTFENPDALTVCVVCDTEREVWHTQRPAQRDDRMPQQTMQPDIRLFIGNLNHNLTESQLVMHVCRHLNVRCSEISQTYLPGGRGFAFINVPRRCLNRIAHLDGTLLQGRRMSVTEAKPSVHKPITNNTKHKMYSATQEPMEENQAN